MVFELTAGAGAVCGAIHRLGKLGVIPSYGYDRERPSGAGLKLLVWAMIIGMVGMTGKFDSFGSGLMFGLIFVGAWKVAEEAAEFLADCVESWRA